MRNGAVAWHAEGCLARVGLEPGHKLLEVLRIHRRTRDYPELEASELRDRYEIPGGVEARLGLHHRQQIHRRTGSDEDRGSVGTGAFDGLDSNQPIAAGTVLDNHVAIEKWTDMLRQDPAKRVATAAGRERKDDLGQRTGLAERIACFRGQRQAEAPGQEVSAIHRVSSWADDPAHYIRLPRQLKRPADAAAVMWRGPRRRPFHKLLELVRHSQTASEPERPRSRVSTGPVSAPASNS